MFIVRDVLHLPSDGRQALPTAENGLITWYNAAMPSRPLLKRASHLQQELVRRSSDFGVYIT